MLMAILGAIGWLAIGFWAGRFSVQRRRALSPDEELKLVGEAEYGMPYVPGENIERYRINIVEARDNRWKAARRVEP